MAEHLSSAMLWAGIEEDKNVKEMECDLRVMMFSEERIMNMSDIVFLIVSHTMNMSFS